jgi:hypothetical protein
MYSHAKNSSVSIVMPAAVTHMIIWPAILPITL